MTLTVTYENLRDATFIMAMRKLASSPNFQSPKAAYNVALINRAIEAEAKTCDKLFLDLVGQHAKKEPDGKLCLANDTPDTFVIAEANQPAWKAALEEFRKISFEISRPKINLADAMAAKVQLAPLEINALEPILFFLEEVDHPQPP